MAFDFDALPWSPDGADRYVVVETPRDARYKYAFDHEAGALRVSFMLARGLAWPYDYGFLPQTLAEDGDPADVVLMMEQPLVPLSAIRARLLGGFEMTKNGERNDRLVACPTPMDGIAMATDRYESLRDLPGKELEQLEQFLRQYAEAQGHAIELKRRYETSEANELAERWHEAWQAAR